MSADVSMPFVTESPRGPAFPKTYGLIDAAGNELLPTTAEEIRYFFEGLASFKRDGLWGVIDTVGQEVIPPRYDALDVFSDGLCRVTHRGRVFFIDRAGEKIDVPRSKYVDLFSEGLCAVADEKARWGFVDHAGALVIAHAFDEVGAFREGLCAAKTKKGWGFIDREGRWVIEPRFKRAWGMKDGRAQVVSTGKEPSDAFTSLVGGHEAGGEYKGLWGVIDREGRYVVAPRFTYRESAIAVVATMQPRKRGDLDLNVLPPVIEGAAPMVDGHYRVRTKRGTAFIDADGNELSGGPFKRAGQLVGGHALVSDDATFRIFSVNGPESEARFADASSNEDVHGFAEGLAAVAMGELGAYRYGFVRTNGDFVIEPRFVYASGFQGALAKVMEADGIAYVDRTGARVWPR